MGGFVDGDLLTGPGRLISLDKDVVTEVPGPRFLDSQPHRRSLICPLASTSLPWNRQFSPPQISPLALRFPLQSDFAKSV
jgi:hypothetical protein